MTFFQYFNMGGPGGGSKISWDGLEYRDIAAFTGPMQKKDVSVGDVGKNCSTHASHGNVGVDIDKTSFPSFTVCMLRFFTRCNIGLAPPVLGSSFSTLFGIIHSLYRQRGKDSYFLVGTLGPIYMQTAGRARWRRSCWSMHKKLLESTGISWSLNRKAAGKVWPDLSSHPLIYQTSTQVIRKI